MVPQCSTFEWILLVKCEATEHDKSPAQCDKLFGKILIKHIEHWTNMFTKTYAWICKWFRSRFRWNLWRYALNDSCDQPKMSQNVLTGSHEQSWKPWLVHDWGLILPKIMEMFGTNYGNDRVFWSVLFSVLEVAFTWLVLELVFECFKDRLKIS